MELSRIKALFGGLILQLLFTIAVPLPYNKYGRQCSDIGCLSSQVCVMAYDSCSLSQREGNDCGRYPTCKKNTEAGLAAGPSDSNTDLYSNTPDRPKPGSSSSDDDVLASLGLNPSNPVPNNRPSAPSQPSGNNGGTNPYQNPYPTLPARQPAQPQYPGGGASGGNNYYGGGGGTGGSSHYGGNRGQFDGAGGNIVVPTQKPPAPSGGGFFGGIFGGIQNAVSNAVKQQVGTYINQRLGIGPAAGQAGGAGGLGGLLDARNFIDQKKFGGLFAEKPSGNSGSSGSGSATSGGGNPYPVTVDQRPIQSVVGQQQYASRSSESSSQYGQRKPQQQGTPAPYGWKLD